MKQIIPGSSSAKRSNRAVDLASDPAARKALVAAANETMKLLTLLQKYSHDPIESATRSTPIGATAKCIPYQHPLSPSTALPHPSPTALLALDQSLNPHHGPCTIRVLAQDALDTTLSLGPPLSLPTPPQTYRDVRRPALLLNLADANTPGGGWRFGLKTQEESIMYRTSLASSLPTRHCSLGRNHYAGGWRDNALWLHPCVVVIRESMADGHGLLDVEKPEGLRMISVISCAAIAGPKVGTMRVCGGGTRLGFKLDADRDLTREKIRGIVRLAARENYTRVVLGALGCGAFGGPVEEVARLFKEVLEDEEFQGWFKDIVFAVLPGRSSDGKDNYEVFKRALDGLTVGKPDVRRDEQ